MKKLQDDVLRRLVGNGLTDPQIAEVVGVHPNRVLAGRKRLGLRSPYNPFDPPPNVRKARSQAAGVGLLHANAANARRVRETHTAYNLPPMTPRCVRVLLSLIDGPLTRTEIVRRVGRLDTSHQTSPLAVLMRMGLVVRHQRAGAARRRVTPDVYMLTLSALEVLSGGE